MNLYAGAASVDITPEDSQFLFGYPHVERYSTGTHDPLTANALYLRDGGEAIFISADVIFVSREIVARVRERIASSTGVDSASVLVSATHTHSGPITVKHLSNRGDPVVPDPDPGYVARLENLLVEAAARAHASARPAAAGLARADAAGIGTNRRDPEGPSDPEVPVLLVRDRESDIPVACMIVCSMHPTVLHEDSKLYSADFPGFARDYLRNRSLGEECVVVYHTGPAGNQSPRHVTRENTFAEAGRIGSILGAAVDRVTGTIEMRTDLPVSVRRETVELPVRRFPDADDAETALVEAKNRLRKLRSENAPGHRIRTAEVDWFGAEETLTLAKAQRDGLVGSVAGSCIPAEVLCIRTGPWSFVGWPGEIFVEYSLEVKNAHPDTFVVSLANGELQGYIATPEAAEAGGYEASNALFSHESGSILVETTLSLLDTNL